MNSPLVCRIPKRSKETNLVLLSFKGQWTWFARFHPEKIPSALDRYLNEIKRVMGVLDKALDGKEYLTGAKATYADLSFITWAQIGGMAVAADGFDVKTEVPNYAAWLDRLLQRPAVKTALEIKEKAAAGTAH